MRTRLAGSASAYSANDGVTELLKTSSPTTNSAHPGTHLVDQAGYAGAHSCGENELYLVTHETRAQSDSSDASSLGVLLDKGAETVFMDNRDYPSEPVALSHS
jgi:hypothetical protein